MKVLNDLIFDSFEDNESSYVFQIFPNIYNDNRGYFTEVIKTSDALPTWMKDSSWIKQINRSSSQSGTIRGCHAQKGKHCQGKLVEALTTKIYDIITDSRPDSKTFGVTKIYLLDPIIQNKLWVPRGFLHSFIVPVTNNNAIFQYFCDNIYDKSSEFGINPLTLIPKVIQLYKQNNEKFDELFEVFDHELNLSDRDKNGLEYETWMKQVKNEYFNSGKLWYK